MYLWAGLAASAALDLVSSLAKSASASAASSASGQVFSTQADPSRPDPLQAAGSARSKPLPALSSDNMSVLLQAQSHAMPNGALSAKVFSTFDVNRDGTIAKAEFLTAIGPNAVAANEIFAAADADGGGSISADEFSAALARKPA